MHRSMLFLLPIVLVTALAIDSDAHAAKTKPKPEQLHSLVELELREVDGGSARELLVPEHGELRGWVELFGAARLCKAESQPTHDERLEIELSCRNERGGDSFFELRSELVLERGEPTVLGELELRDGERLRVTATRR